MALWHILLAASACALGGAGVLYAFERKSAATTTKEVTMPTFSLLGNSAKEYTAREVRIPEPKAPVHIIRQKGNEYEELPLPTADVSPELASAQGHNVGNAAHPPSQPQNMQKKKDDDWTPIDFFSDEKQ